MSNRPLNSADLITSVQLDRLVYQDSVLVSIRSEMHQRRPSYAISDPLKPSYCKVATCYWRDKNNGPINWLTGDHTFKNASEILNISLCHFPAKKIEEHGTPTAALQRAADPGSWDVLRLHNTRF